MNIQNRILDLNNPGKELNVNKINRASSFLLKKKKTKTKKNNWSH